MKVATHTLRRDPGRRSERAPATATSSCVSGDVDAAEEVVAGLFGAAGFATIDLGELVDGGRLQEAGGGVFSGGTSSAALIPESTKAAWREAAFE